MQTYDYSTDHDGMYCEQASRLQALYRAVIMQAVLDAKSRSSKQEMVFWRNRAQHWLFHDRPDFSFICDLAGWHPDDVRRKAENARNRGFFWKNAPLQAVKQKTVKIPHKCDRQLRFPMHLRLMATPQRPPRARRPMAISRYVQLQLAL